MYKIKIKRDECFEHFSDGYIVHRENFDGSEEWCLIEGGELHREDGGPALIKADGTKIWYWEGILHRRGGPAIIKPDGTEEWWINGDDWEEFIENGLWEENNNEGIEYVSPEGIEYV